MKKGFTLIEIIVCIALIAVISVSSIIGLNIFSNAKNDEKLENIANKIYEAASIYIETNKEARKQLYTSNNGVFIPLTVLKNEGLMEFQGIDIEGEYVVTFLGGSTPGDKCVGATTIGSWSKGDHTIYICTDSNLKEEIKQEVLKELGQDSNVLKDAILINAKKADGTTARSILDENNIITTDGINTLTKIGNEYVFEGDVIDNYVNFNGMCFRATRIQEDGSIKLLLQDKDSTCNGENYKGTWSIGKGHFGYTANYVMSGFEYADYLNGETDKQNSMKYLLEQWFDENFNEEKKSYLKENTWTIEDVSSPISLLDYRGRVTTQGKVDELLSESYGTYYWAVYEKNTTFNSYVATMRGGEYQPYMISGTNNYMFLNINAIKFPNHSVISYIDMGQPFVYHGHYFNYGNLVYLGIDCTTKLDIRPMIVLKDSVKINGGAGTQINPYVIEE